MGCGQGNFMKKTVIGNGHHSSHLGVKAEQIEKRIGQLDTLAAILPASRTEQLAQLLTDDDVETLRHLARQGLGANTLRALASDLGYLEAWCMAATGQPLPWPAPESLLLKFVAHHLWDPVQRESNAMHGMPDDISTSLRVQGLLRSIGPHAPATVKRRLTSLSILTRWRGLTGSFSTPSLKSALRLAVRSAQRPRHRKSRKAVTADILSALVATCTGDRLVDIRDRALLLLAFASGGRRRSEVANLRLADLVLEEPVPVDASHPQSAVLPCMTLHLGRTKTTDADEDASVVLIGRPVLALQDWIARAGITEGAVFRRIDQWGNMDRKPLSPQSVNLIVKTRCAKAGLDPADFSAHGLRSGFLTEAANRGIPLPEAMLQSQHKSVAQAASYYNNSERKMSRAARLLV